MDTVRITLNEMTDYFDELEDPRSTINQKLPPVVVIAMMAVLVGVSGPTSIADWAKHKQSFLLEHLDLPNGISRKDVFRRVLCLLRPEAIQLCFANRLHSI